MADIGQFRRDFASFSSTFKATSLDDNHSAHLCNDKSQEVLDFDAIMSDKYPDANTRPKSFDALYVYQNVLFCVEFKNQKPSQINNRDIQEKLEKGKKELVGLLQERHIQQKSFDFIYCVVYKQHQEPRDRYKSGIGKGAIRFELEKYELNGFVKKVFTENINFFTKQFEKQLHKELAC